MSDNADFEEGEVDDFSDLEDLNQGDNDTASLLGGGSSSGSPSRRSVSRVSNSEVSKHRDARVVDLNCKPGESVGGTLLQFLSDDDLPNTREAKSRPSRLKEHRTSIGVKKRRKGRDWSARNSSRPPLKQERARCRFYLEGRCNKVRSP